MLINLLETKGLKCKLGSFKRPHGAFAKLGNSAEYSRPRRYRSPGEEPVRPGQRPADSRGGNHLQRGPNKKSEKAREKIQRNTEAGGLAGCEGGLFEHSLG